MVCHRYRGVLEDWFNHWHLHGQITGGPGYVTPVEHESDYYRDTPAATEPGAALTPERP